MIHYGIDIDGVLVPLTKRDNLETVRRSVRALIKAGSPVTILTARSSAEDARRAVLGLGFRVPLVQVPRSNPSAKGAWLIDAMQKDTRITSVQLWDDEEWFLAPAWHLGVHCVLVKNGTCHTYTPPADYVPYVPKDTP